MSNNNVNKMNERTRMLAEGGICLAMALTLSFIKIPGIVSQGGSIDLVMLPIVFFALRWGVRWGLVLGFALGFLKFFLAGGFAAHWISVFLDYPLAYGLVGLAGLVYTKGKVPSRKTAAIGALIGGIARFIIHFISGFTVYAEYMPDEFMNLKMGSPVVYSLLYNSTYMIPNIIICVLAMYFLIEPLSGLFENNNG